jgi:Uma2 family endonuclease
MTTTAMSRPARGVPRLESGDRLTRDEFERRYAAMPDCRAELVEGVAYVTSPVHRKLHGAPHARLMGWLWLYAASTPGVEVADDATVRLDADNVVQPDCWLRILPAYGGQSRDSADDYVEGAPELVVEVAASSASYDLHDKLRAYRRNGVREYVVWRTEDVALDWFEQEAGRFVARQIDPTGTIASRVFPGLTLDVRALLASDDVRLRDRLQASLGTPEHAAFVASLAARRPR